MSLSKSEAMGVLVMLAGINTPDGLAGASQVGKSILGQLVDMDDELYKETIKTFLDSAIAGLELSKEAISQYKVQ
ncbi:hypothetical protein KASIA_p126 [Shewanella phage vB_SspS_KASIA]|nr:hypothetical protein KASIA_p126 [Shewanella phage vB_SspS_KASIA]